MRLLNRKCFILIQYLISLLTFNFCFATQPIRIESKSIKNNRNEISQSLISNYLQIKPTYFEKMDTSKVIPLSLAPTQDQTIIMKQVGDQTIKTLWDESGVKNTRVGQTLQVVEQKLTTEINLGQSENLSQKKKIEHKLNFELKALQNTANVHYIGYGNVDLSYEALISQTSLSVSQNVFDNKNLVLKQRWLPTDRFSEMYVQWSF